MIKALLIILAIGGPSIYYADFSSDSAVLAVFLPFVAVVSLIALALWFVVLFHRRGIDQNTSRGGGGIDFIDGGGDGS